MRPKVDIVSIINKSKYLFLYRVYSFLIYIRVLICLYIEVYLVYNVMVRLKDKYLKYTLNKPKTLQLRVARETQVSI